MMSLARLNAEMGVAKPTSHEACTFLLTDPVELFISEVRERFERRGKHSALHANNDLRIASSWKRRNEAGHRD
jgi:hypothetical protein